MDKSWSDIEAFRCARGGFGIIHSMFSINSVVHYEAIKSLIDFYPHAIYCVSRLCRLHIENKQMEKVRIKKKQNHVMQPSRRRAGGGFEKCRSTRKNDPCC